MTPEKILQSDVLDILFEGKNKSYGAYELRRKYSNRLKVSLAGMLTIIALITFSYLWATKHNENYIYIADIPDPHLTPVDIPKTDKPKEIPPAKSIQTHQAKTVNYQLPRIVPDDQIQKPPMAIQDSVSHAVVDDHSNDGNDVDDNQNLPGQHGDPQQGTITQDTITTIQSNEPSIFEKVEKMPEFPGGQAALIRFLQRNLPNPELEEGTSAIVKAQFVIDPHGNISDIQIIQSGGVELDDLVKKAIKKMPQWIPGEQNGKNVAVRFIQAVTFQGSNF